MDHVACLIEIYILQLDISKSEGEHLHGWETTAMTVKRGVLITEGLWWDLYHIQNRIVLKCFSQFVRLFM